MFSPMKFIINKLDFTMRGSGQGIVDCWILLRFLYSFSVHNLTIFLGLDLQWPFLNLNSPLMYLSLSLKTRIEVLYILIAYSLFSKSIAWYTFASLPVETHPFISFKNFLFNNFIKITLVLGSRHYSTVALSSLSFILAYLNYFLDILLLNSYSTSY